MKRIAFKITLLFLCLGIWLPMRAEFRWGPVLGGNYSTLKFKQDLIDVKSTGGFTAGVMGEMMFPGIGLGVDIGLNYTMHGAKVNLGEKEVWSSDGYGNQVVNIHAIQIPVNLRFKYTRLNGFEDKLAPFVYGGPIFSITAGHSNIKAYDFPGGCVMLQCGIGAEIHKNYQISAGYYWGMTYEIRTKKLDNFSARSQGWKLSLCYLF